MLKYIGQDGRAVIGIPARDLTEAEVEELGGEEYLLSLTPPLYERATDKARGRSQSIRKDLEAANEIADQIQDGE